MTATQRDVLRTLAALVLLLAGIVGLAYTAPEAIGLDPPGVEAPPPPPSTVVIVVGE